ncbi:hypothetical protein PSTG_09036 [Puccinia striiformis f. sp. tritici PST-78]|uniref:Uncharacterized protein n=1 Tax=Puccinia striiformis f. sp. tritici PST-78 TaxID=1165861 RepID=A0A0L0VEL0_9BASI|nr:hypothetical protein PSTG_09036 [Puccinia striiformis f. sp. tritici PST-78]
MVALALHRQYPINAKRMVIILCIITLKVVVTQSIAKDGMHKSDYSTESIEFYSTDNGARNEEMEISCDQPFQNERSGSSDQQPSNNNRFDWIFNPSEKSGADIPRKELEEITATFHRLRQARDNPQGLETHLKSNLYTQIHQAEESLDRIRAWIIDIFDHKNRDPVRFNGAQKFKLGLGSEEASLWDQIWKSEEESYRFSKKTAGFLGYFYSLWNFIFDNQYWETQQLQQSLRKIRRQLPHRSLLEEERIILQLENVQKAGFKLSWHELHLARKISEMSSKLTDQDLNPFSMPLDLEEGNLLDAIGSRTVAVRREEQVRGLEENLTKKLKTAGHDTHHGIINPDDQSFIIEELQHLIQKERDGLGWTDSDVAWLKSLEHESIHLDDHKKRKTNNLHLLVTTLKTRKLENKKKDISLTDLHTYKKVYNNFFKGNDEHGTMTPEKLGLHSKLGTSPSENLSVLEELTESEIKVIKELARKEHHEEVSVEPNLAKHSIGKELVKSGQEVVLQSLEKNQENERSSSVLLLNHLQFFKNLNEVKQSFDIKILPHQVLQWFVENHHGTQQTQLSDQPPSQVQLLSKGITNINPLDFYKKQTSTDLLALKNPSELKELNTQMVDQDQMQDSHHNQTKIQLKNWGVSAEKVTLLKEAEVISTSSLQVHHKLDMGNSGR